MGCRVKESDPAIQAAIKNGLIEPEAPPKRSKYGNQKTVMDGRQFDSKAEAEYYLVLKDREARGEITDLECQREFELFTNGYLICRYKADFTYYEKGNLVVVDVKGHKTPVYRLKKKLMRACWGIEIQEVLR